MLVYEYVKSFVELVYTFYMPDSQATSAAIKTWVSFLRQNFSPGCHVGSAPSRLLWPDVVTECVLHVDKAGMSALGHLVDSGKVLVGQLNRFEVAFDARWR